MGKIVKGLLGMDSGIDQGKAGIAAGREYAKDVYFKPWTMTSLLGGATYDTKTNQYGVTIDPRLMGITDLSLEGAQRLYADLANFDVQERTKSLFGEQKALLDPVLLQQQIQSQERQYGTGRLGLKLAGEALGATAGTGQVNPDAFGLSAAQSQMLGQLAVGSREQALAEQGTLAQLASGLMGTAMGVEDLAQRLISLGVDRESARSAAATAAGNLGMGGYNMATQAAMASDQAMGSFWGGLFSGAGAAYGGYSNLQAAKFPGSDIALKESIEPIGVLPSGFTWYKWKWKPEYFEWIKKTGRSVAPEEGVLAQEVQHSIPYAVVEDNGYLTVDYSKVLEA